MGHRSQLHQHQLPSHGRSRNRDKPHRAVAGKLGATSDLQSLGRDWASVDRARGEGTGHFRKKTNTSRILWQSNHESSSPLEETSFALEFTGGASKKASGTPIKTLLNEEMSKEKEIRQPLPSLVARLMGLDTLPPQVVHKQQRKIGRHYQKTSTIGFQEKHVSCEDHSLQGSKKKDQEFKDVFEVMETSEVQRMKNQPVQKGKSNFKRSEIDLAYVRQKFMDAKRLSTDKALHNSKELDDALEVLDSNKDLFLKFLQEPNSLFAKHLQDLKCVSPSPNVSHITILKSSKGFKYETSEGCVESERNAERCSDMQKGVMSSFRKSEPGFAFRCLKEHSSPSHELSKSRYEAKTEACRHPTRIVVLKPSLEKAQKMETTISLPISSENYEAGYKRHREFQVSGIQELYAEGSDRQKLYDNVEDFLWRSKSSREIARKITKQMRGTVRCSTKRMLSSRTNGHNREKVSCIMSDMDNPYYSDSFYWSNDCFDDCNSFSTSLSGSIKSSVSREARKHLSERWKMTHRLQEVGPIDRGSSTLGEMLALSDREISNRNLDLFTCQNDSDEKMASGEAIATWGCPTGISSRDGWRGGYSRNLPRSISLPASTAKPISTHRVCYHGCADSLKDKCNHKGSSSCRSFKCHNHSFYPRNSGEEENKLLEREIHVNQEVRSSIHVAHLAPEKPIISEHSKDGIADSHLVGNCSVSEFKDVEVCCIANEEHVEQPMALEVLGVDGVSSCHDHNDITRENASSGHSEEDCLHSPCQITESVATESSKVIEQPSPVSVLEPPSEEEKSSSGCFESLSADLRELRMQLRLLKMESIDTYAEEQEDVIVSDEGAGAECDSPPQIGDILQAFRDEVDRDFSYLLDMLIVSGIHGADWDELSDACHSIDYPVDPSMFRKLEKKYGSVVSWSRPERKLLFDLINSILAGNATSYVNLHPWVNSKRAFRSILAHADLVEDLWQMVVRHQKDLNREEENILEPRWFNLGNDIDLVGRDIEGMLKEDLLEDLVSDFILG